MKKITLIFILFLGVLFSCKETPCDVTEDINKLKEHRSHLRNMNSSLSDSIDTKRETIDSLNDKLKILNIYDQGRTPQYILKIRLKQSHTSLDIGEHMKDAMNAIEFELPVDKNFYNEVEEGTEIVDEFRTGSFILDGSLGSWKMTVRGKEIR
jgi:hypothetical protein